MLHKSLAKFSIVLALFFIVGCESDNKGKIEGTEWKSQSSRIKGMTVPGGMLKLAFRANGTLTYEAGPKRFTGKYTLGTGDRVTFYMDQMLGSSKTHVQRCVIVEDRLTVSDSDGTKMNFTRVK